ncbi:MAG: pyrroline-5-carboxylate reductase [Phycisphaerales bacterium]|nr:pyrroline-5-carboxylate reductase [Phycisphaerales bacterium]
MAMYTLGVIGAGNMGSAVLHGALAAGVLPPDRILVADINENARAIFDALGCATTSSPIDPTQCEQLMLAIKPQVFPAVATTLGALPASQVVISVMAGLSSTNIRAKLGDHARIVRVMPNTPAQVGEGITAIALGAGAEAGDAVLAESLFSAVGKTVRVDEAHMYAVTAVSGSGPAYVFRLAEAMEKAAQEIGLEPDVARQLVAQTIRGAGALLIRENADPAALREAVTSPGGTTAAALDVMNACGFEDVIVDAITAARDRGVTLDG